LSLGDAVQHEALKFYTGFKLIKNFASVLLWSSVRESSDRVYLKLNPNELGLKEGFAEDVRCVCRWGTGALQVTIRNLDELEQAKPLTLKSFEQS